MSILTMICPNATAGLSIIDVVHIWDLDSIIHWHLFEERESMKSNILLQEFGTF